MKKIIIGVFLVVLSVQGLVFAEQYDVWYKHPGPNKVFSTTTKNEEKETYIYESLCKDIDCIKEGFEAGTIFLIPTADNFGFPGSGSHIQEQSNSGKTMYETQKKGKDSCPKIQTYYDFLPLRVTAGYGDADGKNYKNIRYKYSLCAAEKGIEIITKEKSTIKSIEDEIKIHTITYGKWGDNSTGEGYDDATSDGGPISIINATVEKISRNFWRLTNRCDEFNQLTFVELRLINMS